MKKQLNVDVAVGGAGVTGLLLAWKLAALGYRVVLLEQQGKIAPGPSTRNEGWLHSSYHAAAIKNYHEALQVASRCNYGRKQIEQFAPEAIEEPHRPTFALVKDSKQIPEVVARWGDAGVPHRLVPHRVFQRFEPRVDVNQVAAVFAVEDKSLNTRLYYQKVLTYARRNGVRILTDATLTAVRGETATLVVKDYPPINLIARLFVHAAGLGIKSIFKTLLGLDLPMRYWKSHLLHLPRVARHGVFYLDAGEAAMMHHGEVSIVGLHEDAQLVDSPTYDPVCENVDRIRQALRRLVKQVDLSESCGTACIKVDIPDSEFADRSLNAAYGEPRRGHLWVVPGKMTEAPYAVDVLTNSIFERLKAPDDLVAFRPCDHLNFAGRSVRRGKRAPHNGAKRRNGKGSTRGQKGDASGKNVVASVIGEMAPSRLR